MGEIGWQGLALADITAPQSPRLRPSGAGRCARRQYYTASGYEEDEGAVDRHSANRMALGHMAELLIVARMKEDGWETAHTVLDEGQLDLEIMDPGSGFPPVTGHPDGICRHEQWTKNLWVTLECKSMSPDKGEDVRREGVARIYPSYMAQISLYANALYREGLVKTPVRGVFGMMDREGQPLPPERVSWDEQYRMEIEAKVRRVAAAAAGGEPPPRLGPTEDNECSFCPYTVRCLGSVQPRHQFRDRVRLEPESAAWEAGAKWLKADRERREAAKTLTQTSEENNGRTVEGNGVTAGYFYPDGRNSYDPLLLEAKVPKDILESCRAKGKDPRRFWIRETR